MKTNTKWWNSDYVVDIEVHVFFLDIKASGRNVVDLLFNVLPIVCGSSVFVFVLLSITLHSF